MNSKKYLLHAAIKAINRTETLRGHIRAKAKNDKFGQNCKLTAITRSCFLSDLLIFFVNA